MGDVAVTVDKDAESVPTFTTTLAVCVIATALIVADTVFEPAAVDGRLPVATPLTSVVPTGWVTVLPAVGVAATGTVAPWTGLPFAPFPVTRIVEIQLHALVVDGPRAVESA